MRGLGVSLFSKEAKARRLQKALKHGLSILNDPKKRSSLGPDETGFNLQQGDIDLGFLSLKIYSAPPPFKVLRTLSLLLNLDYPCEFFSDSLFLCFGVSCLVGENGIHLLTNFNLLLIFGFHCLYRCVTLSNEMGILVVFLIFCSLYMVIVFEFIGELLYVRTLVSCKGLILY